VIYASAPLELVVLLAQRTLLAADPPQGAAAPTPDETAPTTHVDLELPLGQPPRDARGPGRRPLRYQSRQRPPVVAPPDVHNYPPPGGGIDL